MIVNLFLVYVLWNSSTFDKDLCIYVCSSLSLVIFLVLESVLSAINIATQALLLLAFAWCIFSILYFNYFSSNWKYASCMQHILPFLSVWLSLLLSEVFSLLRITVIINMIAFTLVILLFVFYLLHVPLFLYFPLAFFF